MKYYKTNNRAIYNQWTITRPIIELYIINEILQDQL